MTEQIPEGKEDCFEIRPGDAGWSVGERPSWLAHKSDVIELKTAREWRPPSRICDPVQQWAWSHIGGLRISTDHWAVPYLKRGECPPNRKPAQPRIAPEVVEEAFSLLREIHRADGMWKGAFSERLNTLIAQIEPPVDPLVEVLRECVERADHEELAKVLRGELADRGFTITELAKRTDAESE